MATGDVTALLRAAQAGDEDARGRLVERVYDDLSRLAEAQLRRRFPAGHGDATLEPAALVHESYLRLVEQRATLADREHFFAVATRVMLRVLTDHQRRRAAEKRGGGWRRVTVALDLRAPSGSGPQPAEVDAEALARALDALAERDPRKARVVQLKVLGELDARRIAELLGVSRATVERDWAFAKAWLAREIRRVEPAPDDPASAARGGIVENP